MKINNAFIKHFVGDNSYNQTSRQTPGCLYSLARPAPVKAPKFLAWSHSLARNFNLKQPFDNKENLLLFSGNHNYENITPYANCYGGHQFGHWAGQLGDGRAITLGEVTDLEGANWEFQLKGAGPTAYSRQADGRAVMRSSIREFLMSEAMHFLGVPTTRALNIISTGENIIRDMFYDGHPKYEPGAIVTRVAPSFLRFGNYQLLTSRNEIDTLKRLTLWTINQHFFHCEKINDNSLYRWFKSICDSTAQLIVEWMRVGFVHGVMNTDNMSIHGLTIDYGPYSMLDEYDPQFTPNTTDLPGRRYSYLNQPEIALWNLEQLAKSLAPIAIDKNILISGLDSYENTFRDNFKSMIADKLGLDEIRTEDDSLVESMFSILHKLQLDYTLFFLKLTNIIESKQTLSQMSLNLTASELSYRDLNEVDKKSFRDWIAQFLERFKHNQINLQKSLSRMSHSNPTFILKNFMLHQASEQLQSGDPTEFQKLFELLKTPYSSTFGKTSSSIKRPDWAKGVAGCSALSCSS